MQNVQIFGIKNSNATRAAQRFFKERSVPIQFVDLKQKPMAPGEIKRFIDKFTLQGLLDREGKAFRDAGMTYMRMSDPDILRRLETDPDLLKLPLVRGGKLLSIGHDQPGWKAMLAAT
jgi:arsenate reductase-like glutaredoxin family protein